MTCELTAWPPECRHKPPREGEACTIFSGCGGSDLYCKGFQDGLAGRCTKYSKLGEECDGIVTLCGNKLQCVQDPRYPDAPSALGEGRCFPQRTGLAQWPIFGINRDLCLASYSPKLHRSLPYTSGQYSVSTVSEPRSITFGSGKAATAVVGISDETGGAYGSDGSYGCFRSYCALQEPSAGVSAFVSIGQFRQYADVEGEGFNAYAGATLFVGASRGFAWSFNPTQVDPDDPAYAPIGDLFTLSLGLDAGLAAGLSECTTEVLTVVENWHVIEDPVARCADRDVCAAGPAACTADVSIDEGSTVPGGGTPAFEQVPSGPYAIGETEVTLRVSDDRGAKAECSALVDVRDCTPPTITCSETVAECQRDRSAFVEPQSPTVVDCTAYSVNGPPAASYPLGETPVTYAATDAYFNESTCDTRIRVVDSQAPEIMSASARPAVLWPPNHKMRQVQVTIDARDACDPDAACVLTRIDSNEPDRGWWNWGDRPGDARIVGPRTVELRAERSGLGAGRVYTVQFECRDTTAGNVAHGSVQVMVPHDMR